jgi:hypothetical protein
MSSYVMNRSLSKTKLLLYSQHIETIIILSHIAHLLGEELFKKLQSNAISRPNTLPYISFVSCAL